MATAVMRIDVATKGAGVNGESRNDGEPNLLVTVTSTGSGTNHNLVLLNTTDATPPAIAGVSPGPWTFTPTTGWGETYVLRLTVDDGGPPSEVITTRTYRVPTENIGLLVPGPNEAADPDGSLQNMGAAVVEASYDNAGGNFLGWQPAADGWVDHLESLSAQIPLFDRTGDPTDLAGQGFVYVKDTAAVTELFYIDDTGNVVQLTSDGAISGNSHIHLNDNIELRLGTGLDTILTHNATDTVLTHNTGNLVFDNVNVTGSTIMRLGTNTNATSFEVQSDDETVLFEVDASPASIFLGSVFVELSTVNTSMAIRGQPRATVDTAGLLVGLQGGAAGAASASPGMGGGGIAVSSGAGGAGSGGQPGGAAGLAQLRGGTGGADGGAGGGDGGNVNIEGGSPGVGGTSGTVTLGAGSTSAINIGNAGTPTNFTGIFNVDGAAEITMGDSILFQQGDSNDFTQTFNGTDTVMTLTTGNLQLATSDTSNIAGLVIDQASTGDAGLSIGLNSGQFYTWGVDNDDSDVLVLCNGSAIGTGNIMRITATSDVQFTMPDNRGAAWNLLEAGNTYATVSTANSSEGTSWGNSTIAGAFTIVASSPTGVLTLRTGELDIHAQAGSPTADTRWRTQTGSASTTNADVTTIITITPDDSKRGAVFVKASANDTTNTAGGAFGLSVSWEKAGGTITVDATTQDVDTQTGALPGLSATNSGGDILIQVTGVLATNVEWQAKAEWNQVS